jgi:hypothetical protein
MTIPTKICSADDVRRWTGDRTLADDDTTAPIEAATELVDTRTGFDWGDTGDTDHLKVDVFPNVRMDSLLYLRNWNPLLADGSTPGIVTVQIFVGIDAPSEFPAGFLLLRTLQNSEFLLMPKGRLRLIFYGWMMQQGYDTPVGKMMVGNYEMVKVTYRPDPVIPASVKEGAAIIAATDIVRGPRMIAGLQQESVGGYSYTTESTKSDDDIPRIAQQKLANYTRARIRTT